MTGNVMSRGVKTAEKLIARTVGATIAERRKSKNMTQAELAEHMDVEKETVSRMETGVISPTLSRLSQLAKFLDCEIADLLQSDSTRVTDQALSLATRMENLNDDQRSVLTRLFGNVASTIEKLPTKDRKVVIKFLGDVFQ
jgi:transcriptional regulator with XRE-family HTH domain